MDETRITGNLPNVRIDISHAQDEATGTETMTIKLTAQPSFEGVQGLLGSGIGGLAPLAFNPMGFWAAAAQAWLSPWAALAGANPLLKALAGESTLIQK
jgi:hypothetical protein